MHKRAMALLSTYLLTSLAPCAFAADPSKSEAQTELKAMQSEMKAAQKHADDLAKQADKIKAELLPLQKKLSELAASLHDTETALMQKEAELTQLQAEADAKSDDLKQRRTQIAQSVDAMIELQRVPPEAVVARPGSVKETIRAAQLLSALNQQLQRDAEDLQRVIGELQETQKQLEAKKAEIDAEQKVLVSQRQELETRMKARADMQSKLLADRDTERKKFEKLARNSKSLQELIQKIEAEEARQRALAEENQRKARVQPHDATEIARLDRKDGDRMRAPAHQMRMPVSGKVIKRFGDSGSDGPMRGIRIKASAGATVVAPFKGQVVFTGPFLDYGRMVIIRHPGGYHSLLAGISLIRCVPGQMVVEGEPIGTLGERAPATELYLELRDHSTPVNPSGWFAGL